MKHFAFAYRHFRPWMLRTAAMVCFALCGCDVRADAPTAPTIAWMPDSLPMSGGSAEFDVTWDLWWGTNGDHWTLRQNGSIVYNASLVPNAQNAQHGTRHVSVTQAGGQTFVVDLCAGTGPAELCTPSAPRTVNVGGGGSTGGGDGLVWPAPLLENNQAYSNSNNNVVGAYFVEWGVYGRAFPVRKIPSSNLTHLIYAFIAICGPNDSLQQANPQGYSVLVQECADQPDYTVTIHDRNAALEMNYPGDAFDTPVRGNFGQLARLKAAQPQIKILPSVGGWTLSDPYFHLAGNPARRATFINSVVQFLQTYTFFDGVDLDWEYPGGGGANPSLGSAADKQAQVALLGELRTALNTLGAQTGRTYLMTAAVGAAPAKIAAVDYAAVGQKLDLVFAMTYDYYGGWNGELGHHAGLYSLPNEPEPGFSTDATVSGLINAGVPVSKLAVGVAMYGRGWQGVTGVQANNPFSGTGGAALSPGTWEPGVLDYRQIETQFAGGANGTGANGYSTGYDALAQAPWAWNGAAGKLVTYESPRSAKAKAQYAMSRGLAGVFAWEIDADNGRILNAMHEGLGHGVGGDVIFANGFQSSP
ncbi:MAG: glycosyl hydrolase family 18 protein [Tahibacter sp.]